MGLFEFLLLAGIAFCFVLLGVLAMVFGVLKSGKPIQHCGAASVGPNGEKLNCQLCGGSPEACERSEKGEAVDA